MRFLTDDEARRWCKREPQMLNASNNPLQWPNGFPVLRFVYAREPAPRLFWICRELVAALEYWDEALLWVVLSGVWASSENTHLYYRLRQSYGDKRHLEQAPAHLFLRHEGEDLTTLLHLCLLFGWEAFVFTSHDYARIFVSHDEYGEIAVPNGRSVEPLRAALGSGELKVEVLESAV